MPKIPVQISPEMGSFLTRWLEWAENGARDAYEFRREWGLCRCLMNYSGPDTPVHMELYSLLSKEAHPFGEREFKWAKENRTMHLDENRLYWVRETLLKAALPPREELTCR